MDPDFSGRSCKALISTWISASLRPLLFEDGLVVRERRVELRMGMAGAAGEVEKDGQVTSAQGLRLREAIRAPEQMGEVVEVAGDSGVLGAMAPLVDGSARRRSGSASVRRLVACSN